MPNKNYRAGYRVENKLVNALKKHGAIIAVRTAGSHSLVDVIHVNADKTGFGFVELFQCKTKKSLFDKDKTEQLAQIAKMSGDNILAYNVWPDKNEPEGLHLERIGIPLKTIDW